MATPELMPIAVSVTSIPHAHMTYMHRRRPPSNRAMACRRAALVSLGVLFIGVLLTWLAYSVSSSEQMMGGEMVVVDNE